VDTIRWSDEKYFFTGDDPFLSHDPKIRVRVAQLAHAYKSAVVNDYRALAEKLKKDAYQLRATERLGQN
jgi:lipopolysaccharide biosynthesis protein